MGKKQSREMDLQQVKREYETLVAYAENLRSELTRQIERLLKDEKIALGFPIESHVKNIEASITKFRNASFQSIADMQDIVGLRLILQFQRDVTRVVELLTNQFDVVKKYNTGDRLKEDQFGYTSIHLVVKTPSTWQGLPTLAGTNNFQAEIQVRTIAQHIWAATSHTLQYKQEESVPPGVRRALYRVSALLETVDLEFERVLDQREQYREVIGEGHDEQSLLNVDLLEKTLDELLPPANKTDNESYSELLEDLRYMGVNTPDSLKAIIKKNKTIMYQAEAKELAEREEALAKGQTIHGTTIERIRSKVFFYHVGLVRTALEAEFGDKFKDYLRTRHK